MQPAYLRAFEFDLILLIFTSDSIQFRSKSAPRLYPPPLERDQSTPQYPNTMAITITAPAPAHLSNPLYNNTGNYDNEDANNTTALDRDLDLDSDADGDVDMLNTTGKSRNRSGRPKTKAILTPGECVTEDGQWMRYVHPLWRGRPTSRASTVTGGRRMC